MNNDNDDEEQKEKDANYEEEDEEESDFKEEIGPNYWGVNEWINESKTQTNNRKRC